MSDIIKTIESSIASATNSSINRIGGVRWNIGTGNTAFSITNSVFTNSSTSDIWGGDVVYNDSDSDLKAAGYKRAGSKRWGKKKRGDKAKSNDPSNRLSISPKVFFKITKKRFSILQTAKLEARLHKIGELMEEFQKSGQIALKDMLEDKFRPFLKEQELFACGFTQYISKENLYKFIEKTDRKIEMTPIKNYARIIPKAVLKQQSKADEKNLFDGYIIAHTSGKKASLMTREERKDPIMFGIIQDSANLYFVGDWEDELCDLRFDEVVDTLSLNKDEYKMQSADKELEKMLEILKG